MGFLIIIQLRYRCGIRKKKRYTRSNQSQTSFMGIEGLINGHDREPKTWHEYVDEEKGSKRAQCHEGQHGSRARVRCPTQIWEERTAV
jgi:hypothetical protein